MTHDAEKLLTEILLKGDIPQHVAIIMDGNGRWAQERGKPRIFGHKQGAHSVRQVVQTAGEVGVKVLTLYAFSEENWGRARPEVSALMRLLDVYLVKERENLHKNNVSLRVMGDIGRLPERTQKAIQISCDYLHKNTGLILNIAISYGARSEIVEACKQIAQQVAQGKLNIDQINKELFASHLQTKDLPEPDLLIRTSGELRISNFLLWQLAYAELYFTQDYWPDFDKIHFFEAIKSYQSRKRRYGMLPEQIASSQSERIHHA